MKKTNENQNRETKLLFLMGMSVVFFLSLTFSEISAGADKCESLRSDLESKQSNYERIHEQYQIALSKLQGLDQNSPQASAQKKQVSSLAEKVAKAHVVVDKASAKSNECLKCQQSNGCSTEKMNSSSTSAKPHEFEPHLSREGDVTYYSPSFNLQVAETSGAGSSEQVTESSSGNDENRPAAIESTNTSEGLRNDSPESSANSLTNGLSSPLNQPPSNSNSNASAQGESSGVVQQGTFSLDQKPLFVSAPSHESQNSGFEKNDGKALSAFENDAIEAGSSKSFFSRVASSLSQKMKRLSQAVNSFAAFLGFSKPVLFDLKGKDLSSEAGNPALEENAANPGVAVSQSTRSPQKALNEAISKSSSKEKNKKVISSLSQENGGPQLSGKQNDSKKLMESLRQLALRFQQNKIGGRGQEITERNPQIASWNSNIWQNVHRRFEKHGGSLFQNAEVKAYPLKLAHQPANKLRTVTSNLAL